MVKLRCSCGRMFAITEKHCPKCGATVPREGKKYVVDLMVRGKRVVKTLGSSLTDAREIEAKIKNDLVTDQYFEPQKDPTLDDIFQSYNERAVATGLKNASRVAGAYRKYIQPAFGRRQISKITPLEVQKWSNALYRTETQYKTILAPKTIKDIIALLNSLYRHAEAVFSYAGHSPTRAVKYPKVNNIKNNVLSQLQWEKLLNVLDEATGRELWSAGIIRLIMFTGLRRGEVFRLKWADIDYENRLLKIRQPKSGYDETIPLNDEALAILKKQEHFSRGWSAIVFPGYQGKERHDIERAWANIKNKAGLPKEYRLHDLRHTFASRLVAKGASLYIVQKLLRHRSPTMTMRYAHLQADDLRAASALVGKA